MNSVFCSKRVLVESLVSVVCPSLSKFLCIDTITYHKSQTLQFGAYLIMITINVTPLDAGDAIFLIVRRPLIFEQTVLPSNRLGPLPHTPAFDVEYRLRVMPSLDHRLNLEMEETLDLRRDTMVRLVRPNFLQLNRRLTCSSGFPMAQGYLNMIIWVFWRYVLAVVTIFLAVFFVVMLLLAWHIDDDV